jgi:hypothetical protein
VVGVDSVDVVVVDSVDVVVVVIVVGSVDVVVVASTAGHEWSASATKSPPWALCCDDPFSQA